MSAPTCPKCSARGEYWDNTHGVEFWKCTACRHIFAPAYTATAETLREWEAFRREQDEARERERMAIS